MTEHLGLEIDQIEIKPGSPMINRALRDTGIRSEHDVIVIAIKRGGEMIFNPSADAAINEGDFLVAIGSHDSLQDLDLKANPSSASLHRHH